jgi:uncharacterized iron-regulated membrane protein
MNSLAIRRWHGYIGMSIAPSVLFFALTGAVQLFSLHEAHGKYQPPQLLEELASVHKDQVFASKQASPDSDHAAPAQEKPSKVTPAAPPDHDAVPGSGDADAHEHHHEHKPPRVSVYLLKWFFLFVAVGLATSTVLGIWMGLKPVLHRRTHVLLLLAGAVVPLGLILL